MNIFANAAANLPFRMNRVSDESTFHREDSPVAWLQRCAERLALPPIAAIVAKDLREALPFPLSDPRYSENSLVPGIAPLEVSFAEAQGRALRLDLEPIGFGIAAADRRGRAAAVAVRWAAGFLPPVIARDFERRLNLLCRRPIEESARFGAFLGATFDEHGLAEAKFYSEWSSEIPIDLTERLAVTANAAMATIPGIHPHFASISCGQSGCIPRLYFLCREEVPVLALYDVLETVGLSHRLAELVSLTLTFAGVTAILPANACVLSFRDVAGVIDCKLEILAHALPIAGQVFAESVRRSLAERPEILAAFRRWWNAMGGTNLWPEEFNAVGFRISSTTPAQFGAYLSPERISELVSQ